MTPTPVGVQISEEVRIPGEVLLYPKAFGYPKILKYPKAFEYPKICEFPNTFGYPKKIFEYPNTFGYPKFSGTSTCDFQDVCCFLTIINDNYKKVFKLLL